MARFTNIGMPRKSFVASAAEEAATKPQAESDESAEAGPSTRKSWGRDPEIASELYVKVELIQNVHARIPTEQMCDVFSVQK